MDEQGTVLGNLLKLDDEFVRMLGVRKRLGGIQSDNVVGDDLVGLVCKVGFLSGRDTFVGGEAD